MAKRKTDGFEVFYNDGGSISIKQDSFNSDDIITIHPEQVPLLIKWLNDVCLEIKNGVYDGSDNG